MSTYPPFAARPLEVRDVPAAERLAGGAGVQGVYLRNVLAAHPELGPEAEFLALHGRDGLLGMAYFGPRGNLLLVQREPMDPALVAQAILGALWGWRIVLGPLEVVEQLLRLGRLRALVNREQIYYAVTYDELQAGLASSDVRRAEKKDLARLMEAALDLNESDLRVDRWRVDRDWLKRSTKGRIRDRTTCVIGPLGRPLAKLDVGSRGPAGVVIEGVYTRPEVRGCGLAVGLIAAVAAEALADVPLVCLHVAADNAAARRAYEKCGMRPAGTCQLMLRD